MEVRRHTKRMSGAQLASPEFAELNVCVFVCSLIGNEEEISAGGKEGSQKRGVSGPSLGGDLIFLRDILTFLHFGKS